MLLWHVPSPSLLWRNKIHVLLIGFMQTQERMWSKVNRSASFLQATAITSVDFTVFQIYFNFSFESLQTDWLSQLLPAAFYFEFPQLWLLKDELQYFFQGVSSFLPLTECQSLFALIFIELSLSSAFSIYGVLKQLVFSFFFFFFLKWLTSIQTNTQRDFFSYGVSSRISYIFLFSLRFIHLGFW